MEIETTPYAEATAEPAERAPVRKEMRPARGLLVGLTLSAIIWLGLLVLWLAW